MVALLCTDDVEQVKLKELEHEHELSFEVILLFFFLSLLSLLLCTGICRCNPRLDPLRLKSKKRARGCHACA
jgi:hypothetical protein